MGMFHLGKCPRCWDYPCHCETDAYGDPIAFAPSSSPLLREADERRRRELELLEEQNRLLREINDKLSR